MRHVLSFVGITDVEVIAADRLVRSAPESLEAARNAIGSVEPLAA